jgi:transposase-like protein
VSKWDKKRTNKQYSKEYTEEAVALIRDQGYTVPEAAKSLGIASNILYRWKDKIASDLEGKLLSTDKREELCSGLIEPDTLIRDNIYQLLRCRNGTKTNEQTVFKRI